MTYPESDEGYREEEIAKVSKIDGGFELQLKSGLCFSYEGTQVIPFPGMLARFYGEGLGYPVRGLFVDGKKVFYRTDAEESQRKERMKRERLEKMNREFPTVRENLEARIAKLPEAFQERIRGFTERLPDWLMLFGQYEVFCLECAVALVKHCKTLEGLKEFHALQTDDMEKALPELRISEHTGNTFGFSMAMASLLVANQDRAIYLAHGALCPLTGCEDYGCASTKPAPKEVAEETCAILVRSKAWIELCSALDVVVLASMPRLDMSLWTHQDHSEVRDWAEHGKSDKIPSQLQFYLDEYHRRVDLN